MPAPAKFEYMPGFGNHHCSEALPDSLPKDQNTPQVCPRGLYAEQLSGTAFTVPRAGNQRAWLYRIRPSVMHTPMKPTPAGGDVQADFSAAIVEPNQLRWRPFALPADGERVMWHEGLKTVAGAGAAETKSGMAVHVYTANADMVDTAFCNADGDMLIVPQLGKLHVQTEFGWLDVAPGEICVVQRGMRFAVFLPDGPSRGYVAEVYDGHFRLPDLGPIGANGLANARDFLTPVAAFEDRDVASFAIVHKFLGKYFQGTMTHSPFNVVAWHGNYAPYKYNLDNFNVVNSVSFDHLDPSIFTVLTCATNEVGVACCDFVIFPPRWAVQEHTFRPPYYHRNLMSEYMGLIRGTYEAKEEGFVPGGGSLHSCMQPHGPDTNTFVKASQEDLKPVKIPDTTMAFMFESTYVFRVTDLAHKPGQLDENYYKCWADLPKQFDASL